MESTEANQLKLHRMVYVTGIVGLSLPPFFVGNLMDIDPATSLWLDLVPCLLLIVVMMVCIYLPGGKMAGQIPWEAIVEHEAKISLLNGDNEMESEFLGGDSIDMSKSSQKTVPMLAAPATGREEELVQTARSGSLLGYTATPADSQYASGNGETMEICRVWLIQTNKQYAFSLYSLCISTYSFFLLPRSFFSNCVLVSFTLFGHPLGIVVCFDRCLGRCAAAELEQLLGLGKQRGLEGFVLPIAEPNLHTIIYLVVADV